MVDLENGYLCLVNQIQDVLCIVELLGCEFCVLNVIIWLIYGWLKKLDCIVNSFIVDKIILKVKYVFEVVLSFVYCNIIILCCIG